MPFYADLAAFAYAHPLVLLTAIATLAPCALALARVMEIGTRVE